MLKISDIARIAHESNRAYCAVISDPAYPPQEAWDLATQGQRDSLVSRPWK